MLRSLQRVLVLGVCAWTLGQSVAVADGVDAVAPDPVFMPAPPMMWNSIYVGVHGGWADAQVDWSYGNASPYSTPGLALPIVLDGDSFSPDGFAGGGQIGFNHQFGQWVLGAEVSYSGLDLDETHESPRQLAGAGTTTFVTSSVNDLLTVTAKLGIAFDPRWLVYLKGGYASAEVETRGFIEGAPGLDFAVSEREDGWVIGAGAEYKITNEIGLGLEYTHVDLGSSSRIGDLAALPSANDVAHDVNTDIDAVMVRLNWHFNRSRPVMQPLK